MEVVDFEVKYCKEATMLAAKDYERERQYSKVLPAISKIPDITWFAENNLGVAAIDNGRLIGFLCSYPPIDNIFGSTDAKGLFAPMGAHAAVTENRARIYESMYQAAARKWVQAGAVSHAVGLYASDNEVLQMFFQNGFGMRCMDAFRNMEPVGSISCDGLHLEELAKEQFYLAYPLDAALYEHYRKSPFFMNRKTPALAEFIDNCTEEGARIFAGIMNGKVCAYMKITGEGETFIAKGDNYCHITGAYCETEFRGKNIMQNLMDFALERLRAAGITSIGVDFETINPTALHFWKKYFTSYTISVVRRIDEKILQLP